MDIQTRKLNLLQNIINIDSEELLMKIEQILFQSSTEYSEIFEPLSQEDIISRAKLSNSDYLNGDIIEHEQLEVEANYINDSNRNQ